MNTVKEKKQFKSSDFYLACFLFAAGVALESVDKSNPKRAVFIFESSKKVESQIQYFLENKATINPRDFAHAIKELKQRLYSNFLK